MQIPEGDAAFSGAKLTRLTPRLECLVHREHVNRFCALTEHP